MSDNNLDLEPCPLCGGPAVLVEPKTDIKCLPANWGEVACPKCDALTGRDGTLYVAHQYDIEVWNRRARNSVAAKLRAQLETERIANAQMLNNIEHLHDYIARLQEEVKRLKGEA